VAAIELAQKSAAGKLRLVDDLSPRDYFARVLAAPGFREVSVSVEIALGAYQLPGHFHKDPADRLIVATARLLDAPVVTIDRRILAYSQLGHVDAIAY